MSDRRRGTAFRLVAIALGTLPTRADNRPPVDLQVPARPGRPCDTVRNPV